MESLVYKFFRVFFRDRVSFPRRGPDFKAVETKNIDLVFAGPLLHKLVNISQLYKTGIGFDDILDLNELLAVKNENEYRANKAQESKK